jgi:hypothetical protein
MFTAHTLPIWANWAQVIGDIGLPVALAGFYLHHRCAGCLRWGRYKVGDHHVPACKNHRHTVT